MALSMAGMRVGTIVDHYWKCEGSKVEPRERVRRGILEKVVEDSHPLEVWVKFKPGAGSEKIAPAELNVVQGPTKESVRMVRPTVENPKEFMEFKSPDSAVKRVVEDEFGIVKRNTRGVTTD